MVEFKYFNGSIVHYNEDDTQLYRVVSRSYNNDGAGTYTLEPVTVEILEPDAAWNRRVRSTHNTIVLSDDRHFEVFESDITPILPDHVTKEFAGAAVGSGSGRSDMAHASDTASISRE